MWSVALMPLAMYLLVFFAQPIILFVLQSFGWPHPSLKMYAQALGTSTYLRIIWDTIRLSLVVAAFCTLAGYPLAYCLTVARPFCRSVLWAAVLLPLWTNVLVRSYAWIVILRVHGVLDAILSLVGLSWQPRLLYNDAGVTLGMTQVLLPYMVLTLYSVMREIDPHYLRAAANLGAPPRSAFWRIYLPLSLPGIVSGFMITFLLAIGFYITPALLGGGNVLMISLQIAEQITELVNWPFGSALSVILVVVVAVLVIAFVRLFNARLFGMGGKWKQAAVAESTEPQRATPVAAATSLGTGGQSRPPGGGTRHYTHAPWPWRWWLVLGVSALVCLFLVVPVFIVVAMSFSNTSFLVFPPRGISLRWYGSFFHSAQWMSATWVSLRAAILTAVLSLVLGAGGAFAFVRGRFVGKSAAYVAVLLPMIVPVIVTAVAIYSLFSRLHLVGTWWGFALADTVIAVPMVVLIVSAALEGVNVSLERAAMILGASPLRALWEVTLPIIAPALIAGALFAFITSFDESVISLFLSTTITTTLPKMMWDSLRFEISPTISAIAALLVGLSAVTLVISGILIGRKSYRSGV